MKRKLKTCHVGPQPRMLIGVFKKTYYLPGGGNNSNMVAVVLIVIIMMMIMEYVPSPD